MNDDDYSGTLSPSHSPTLSPSASISYSASPSSSISMSRSEEDESGDDSYSDRDWVQLGKESRKKIRDHLKIEVELALPPIPLDDTIHVIHVYHNSYSHKSIRAFLEDTTTGAMQEIGYLTSGDPRIIHRFGDWIFEVMVRGNDMAKDLGGKE